MVGWSHFPPEIKQHVVKKLDFMSRHSLKCTSYTDRQIVNSTPLNIPRVRFGHKDGRCLIVIYTGVEQFLRWDLFDEDDGVKIERCENCYDTAGFKRMSIQNADSFQVGIHILKTLLAHKSIKTDVFEWDIPYGKNNGFGKKMSNMKKYLNGDKFRATEVVSVSRFDDIAFLEKYAKRFCCEVKEFQILTRSQADDDIVRKTIECKGVTDDESNSAIIILQHQLDGIEAIFNEMLEETKQYEKPTIGYSIERELENKNSPARQIQRSEEDGLIKLTCTTKCGKYTMTMFPKDELYLRDQLVDMECGMSWLCKSCADPFEYWYHQNLTMRLVHEPFWAFALNENGVPSAQLMKLLEQKVNKRPKPFKSSWGFKKIEPILQTTKNPSQKKSRILKKELKDIEGQKLQKRPKEANLRQRIKSGVSMFFIWFGAFLVCCIALSFVLNLVM